jgi:sialate O-acetylesterase
MNRFISRVFITLVLTALGAPVGASSDVPPQSLSVSPIFGDNMVLQRGLPIKIWGGAKPKAEVTVKFAGREKTGKADAAGNWLLTLDPSEAGGPLELSILSGGETIFLKNVLVGDVWVCSGQSNMEMSVESANNAENEILNANQSAVRLYTVEKKAAGKPLSTLAGRWLAVSSASVRDFSAVCYFFGREINRELKAPIGLINSSWGGTLAEAWTPWETLESEPKLNPIILKYKEDLKGFEEKMESYNKTIAQWDLLHKDGKEQAWKDDGNKGAELGWAAADFNDSGWKEMTLPALWETIMDIDGAVWFRKEVQIPRSWMGKNLDLSLGPVDNYDVAYFNGAQVGATGAETSDSWRLPRTYKVPAKLLKPGKNVIAVRVFDDYADGGFGGAAKDMFLSAAGESVSMAGPWKYNVESELPPAKRADQPPGPENPNSPSTLYNGMINPLIPYGIKGVLWYQGESNAGMAYQYRTLLPALITSWRKNWAQGDFPFLIVQLANYMPAKPEPGDSYWAELREAQAMTAANLANSGLAVAIDIGDAEDIHPKNKQEAGRRLSLAALKTAYGMDIIASGPVYDSMTVEGGRVRLRFKNIGGGLSTRNGNLKQFAISGPDRKFVWAMAKIEGDEIVVESGQVKEPAAVRYAWAENPQGCNLYNQEGLPAVPFRTDSWPGVTENAQ